MSLPTQLPFLVQQVHTISLSFLGVIHKILVSYKHAKLYENFTYVHMWPAAIATASRIYGTTYAR